MASQDGITITEPLSLSQKAGYGCGDLSSNLVWGMTLSFLMYYYTDIYLIPVAVAAWILLVPRVVDAFTDPLFGYLIDRSGGRYVLPLIGRLAIPFGIATLLCFLPLPFSPTGKIIWASLSYLVLGVIYSAVNVPYGVLSNMIAVDPQERVSLNAFRMGGCQLGQLAVAGLTLPAIAWLGGGGGVADRQRGITLLMVILAAVGSALWLLTWRSCKIRRPLPVNQTSFRELMAALVGNRRWHLVNTLTFMNFIVFCSQGGLAIHYTRYILGLPTSYASILLAGSTFWALIGALGVPFLTKRFGTRRTYIGCNLAQAAMIGTIYLAPDNFPVVMGALSFQYLGVGAVGPLYYAMLADAVDANRKRTGVAAAGLAFSINGLISKVAAGLAGFIIATFLAWGHYSAGVQVATPLLKSWILMGFLGLPLAALSVALVVLFNSRKDHAVAGEALLLSPAAH